jgi:hypothetical protein
VRKNLIATLAVALLVTAGAGIAQAKPTRASRSVAGVRATLDQWANLLLSDKAKAACAMLTPHGQAVWAKTNSASTCIAASKADYAFLKQYPTDAQAIRDYGNTEPVTLHGNTASLPKLSGGTRTLLYQDGLWYINS